MKKNNITTNYHTNSDNTTQGATWHYGNKNSDYIIGLKESIKASRLSMNDSDTDVDHRKKCMEDWYENLIMLYDNILYYLELNKNKEKKEELKKEFAEIERLSDGVEFFQITDGEALNQIKWHLRKITTELTKLEYKYELTQPAPVRSDFDHGFA